VSNDVLEGLREELRSLNMKELSNVSGLPTWRLRELVKPGRDRRTSVWARRIASQSLPCGSGSHLSIHNPTWAKNDADTSRRTRPRKQLPRCPAHQTV
jgi:hypothetical protein